MTFDRLENLNGKIVVITGGGRVAKATAKHLSQVGAKIILLVRKELENSQLYLNTLGNNHKALYTNILDTDSIKNAIKIIKEKYGGCDILINTAGRSCGVPPNKLNELTDDIFDEIIKTNIRGTFSIIREFSEMLHNSGDGLVVIISSAAGIHAGKACIAYGASKAALDWIVKSLGRAMAPTVRVIGIAPGWLEGPTSGIKITSSDFIKNKIEQTPLSRIGNSDDIAIAIRSFALDIRFATGATLIIDGGRTA